jgi:hypothetical protein
VIFTPSDMGYSFRLSNLRTRAKGGAIAPNRELYHGPPISANARAAGVILAY